MSTQPLDVYDVAYLVGGPTRMAEVALVEMVETGRVRVQSSGQLTVLDSTARHPAEQLVVNLMVQRPTTWPTLKRQAQRSDCRDLEQRLREQGLIASGVLPRTMGRLDRSWGLTGAGRAARTAPPDRRVTAGPSADAVARGGVRQVKDAGLRQALLPRAVQPTSRRRGGNGWVGGSAMGGGGDGGSSGSNCGGSCGGGGGCGGGGS